MHSTGAVKRIAAIVLALIMCLSFVACGNKGIGTDVDRAGEIISETDTELTIVDQTGTEVTVKKNPESIALCYRVVIRFLLSLGQGDKIKGIGKSEDFLEELQPSLKNCVDVGKGVVDIEAIAELGPDLFIHKASDMEGLNAVRKLGISAVGIDVETPESMMVALAILGKVCGADKKAQQLIDYYETKMSEVKTLTDSLENDDKKTAIVMGTSVGKVADGTMLQGKMLEAAGAVNCAADMKTTELWPTAGTEQIFTWNPDYIFITGSESAMYAAEDIYDNVAWSELEAVKNKHIYVIPSGKDSWEFPGVVSILGIDFMMNVMYPELLSDQDVEKNVDEFYELSYGRTLDREVLGY